MMTENEMRYAFVCSLFFANESESETQAENENETRNEIDAACDPFLDPLNDLGPSNDLGPVSDPASANVNANVNEIEIESVIESVIVIEIDPFPFLEIFHEETSFSLPEAIHPSLFSLGLLLFFSFFWPLHPWTLGMSMLISSFL